MSSSMSLLTSSSILIGGKWTALFGLGSTAQLPPISLRLPPRLTQRPDPYGSGLRNSSSATARPTSSSSTSSFATSFRVIYPSPTTVADSKEWSTLSVISGGHPDRSLVFTTLRGLNGRFSHMTALLKRQHLFPMFLRSATISNWRRSSSCPNQGGPLHGSGGHHSRCSPTVAGCPNQRYTTNRQHVSSASEEVKQQEQVQGNNRSIRSLPTPTHPWSGTLQLWAAVAAARPGGPGLLGACPGLPQPHLAPQQTFFTHGRSIEFFSLSTNYYSF
jgi:hypothetical protein